MKSTIDGAQSRVRRRDVIGVARQHQQSDRGIFCCQARVASTEPRPLPSVVTTSVGHAIFGRSGAHVDAGTPRMKPSCVEAPCGP